MATLNTPTANTATGFTFPAYAYTHTFEMNGCKYDTGLDTIQVLRSIVPSARKSKDYSAVQAIMVMGLHSGRIKPNLDGLTSEEKIEALEEVHGLLPNTGRVVFA